MLNSSKKMLFSTMKVVAISIIIKALGLIKQAVLAAYCGASAETDAFFVATGTMVNISTIVFSAISVSLLTIHTNTLISEGRKEANKLINAVLRVFLPIAFLFSIVFFLAATYVAKILAPTYQGDEIRILANYIRAMSPVFVLWCYYLTINVILETDKQFVYGKGQGLFQNLFLIIGACFLYPQYGMPVLVYAFLFSGFAECILVTCAAKGKFHFVRNASCSDEIKRLVAVFLPLLLGNAIYEVNSIVDGQIATSLEAGRASVLSYGATINDMVVGVLITSVSTVLFSNFSTWIAKGEIENVERSLQKSIEYLTLLLLPVMVMCFFAGDQIITLFYGRGSFGEQEIKLTYGVVIGYAAGFVFQAARANLIKVYYAFQDSRKPMMNGLLAICLNIVLSICLSKIIGIAGVALATSISMFFVTCLLLVGVKRYLPKFGIKHCGKEICKGLTGAAISSALVIVIKINVHTNMLLAIFIEGIAVVIVYISCLIILRAKIVQSEMRKIKRMLFKDDR